MRYAIAAIAAAAIIGFAAPAFADAPSMSRGVSHADLDLSTQAGAQTMLQRMNRAARSVCRDAYNPAGFGYRQCVSRTMNTAVTALNAPMVTAMYGGATPAPTQIAQTPDPRG